MTGSGRGKPPAGDETRRTPQERDRIGLAPTCNRIHAHRGILFSLIDDNRVDDSVSPQRPNRNHSEMYRCHLAGLEFASSVLLDGFPPLRAACDITIQERPVVCTLAGELGTRSGAEAMPGRWLLRTGEGCRFLVEEGERVSFERETGFPSHLLTLYLTNPVLAVVLQQRGLLPLHASAIQADGGGIAFAGGSGTGKSSLAAWFAALGHVVLSDDICPIDCSSQPVIAGGWPELKISERVAQQLFPPRTPTLPLDRDERGRRRLRLAVSAPPPMRLLSIYVLRANAGQGDIQIQLLESPSALRALLHQSYRPQPLTGMGLRVWQFATCASIASSVPVYAVTIPPGIAHLGKVGARLKEHIAGSKGSVVGD